MKSLIAFILGASLLVASSAGGAESEDRSVQVAVPAAQAWLEIVDAAQYPKSWEAASQIFKQALSEDTWSQKVTAARQPLGNLVTRKLSTALFTHNPPGAPEGDYVIIQYESAFANNSHVVETVTPMRDPDGQWRVSGYFIRIHSAAN
ncbi:MAG: DUF4019 domain-containing protein [Burkholderiaceae bacterium]